MAETNKEGTYVIKSKDKEVLYSCRTKALANIMLKKLRESEHDRSLFIEKTKW